MKTPFTIAAENATERGNRSLARRIRTEGKIAGKIVDAILAAGFTVGVNDGEETVLRRSTDRNAAMQALFSTDEDYILAYNAAGKKIGSVFMVYGNDGYDVVNDYSTSMTDIMRPIEEYAERLEEGLPD